MQYFCVLFQRVEKDEGILCVTDHALASIVIASTRPTLTSWLIYVLVILAFEVRKVWCRNHSRGGETSATRRAGARWAPARPGRGRPPRKGNPLLPRAAMSSAQAAPTYYVIFATVAVLVLKAVNEEVTEPYMVRAAHECLSYGAQHVIVGRTSPSTSRRCRHTARAIIGPGTQRSPLLLDCEWSEYLGTSYGGD